jgi:ATP-binding cassette, subfamily B, bacterial
MDCVQIRQKSDKQCLRMIAKHYGKNYSNETLRDRSYITREGFSLLGTNKVVESISF